MAKSDIGTIACALVSIAIGIFIGLSSLGIIPSRGAASEQTLGLAVGSAFVLGGLAVIFRMAGAAISNSSGSGVQRTRAKWVERIQFLLFLGIMASLAVTQSWIAFGPGERHFRSSIPFLPSWASEPMGRIAFGLGAALCWAVFLALVAIGLSRFRNRDSSGDA